MVNLGFSFKPQDTKQSTTPVQQRSNFVMPQGTEQVTKTSTEVPDPSKYWDSNKVKEVIAEAERVGDNPDEVFADYAKNGYKIEGYDEWMRQNITTTAQQPQEEKGFLGKVGDIFQRRGENIGESFGRDQTWAETALQTAGNIVGGAGDVLFEGVVSGAQAITPDIIENAVVGGAKDAFNALANTDIGKQGLQALQGGVESYNQWAEANPRAAANLGAVVDLTDLIGGKVVKGGVKLAKEGVEQAVVQGAKALPEVMETLKGVKNKAKTALENQEIKETLDITRPNLSKAKQIEAFKKGQGRKEGILQETVVDASKRDLDIAEASKGIVKKSANEFENIAAIDKEISKIGKEVKAGLENNDAIFTKKEFQSALDSVEKPLLLKSDKAIDSAYEGAKKLIVDTMSGKKNKLSSVLQARKDFDKLVKKQFGDALLKEGKTTPLGEAVKGLRRKMNDFISERLPDGDIFKESLKKQNLLFEAKDNISAKAPTVGTNRLTKLVNSMKNNVVNTALIGLGVGSTSLGAILSSPLLLGAGVVGGAGYGIKKAIQSPKFKRAIIEGVERLEEKLKKTTIPEDKKAIEDTIKQLKEFTTPAGLLSLKKSLQSNQEEGPSE